MGASACVGRSVDVLCKNTDFARAARESKRGPACLCENYRGVKCVSSANAGVFCVSDLGGNGGFDDDGVEVVSD